MTTIVNPSWEVAVKLILNEFNTNALEFNCARATGRMSIELFDKLQALVSHTNKALDSLLTKYPNNEDLVDKITEVKEKLCERINQCTPLSEFDIAFGKLETNLILGISPATTNDLINNHCLRLAKTKNDFERCNKLVAKLKGT